MKRKIVIAEAGAASNIGSMALIENAINICRRFYNSHDIIILCADVNDVTEALKRENMLYDNISIKKDFFIPPHKRIEKWIWLISNLLWIVWYSFISLFFNKPYLLIFGRKKDIIRDILDSEKVICIGAERINDIYYKIEFFSMKALEIYENLGAKLYHLSLTIGPIFKKYSIKKAAKVLNNSAGILVRDKKSYDLLDELHVTKPVKFSSYDIALFQHKGVNGKDILYNELKLLQEKPIIAISVINWRFTNVTGPSREIDYHKAVAGVADYLIEKYNYQVVFVPTLVGEKGAIDDVLASNKVKQLMRNKEQVSVIERLLLPSELSSLFSYCKYSIVTRMHAAILCSGAGNTPIISINYLYKLREYMKNIHQEELSVDIDYVNYENLQELIEKLEKNYLEVKQKLPIRIEEIRTIVENQLKECFSK